MTPEVAGQLAHVLVAVSGGIAAYKACEVVRGLQKSGCEVRVVMTEDARRFVGAATFEGLTHHPVPADLYSYPPSAIPHIDLSGWADICVVVPATANLIAKMAAGIADEIVCTTLLACSCPVVVAPAMNTRMWSHPATQQNVDALRARGVRLVLPEEGRLACGDEGAGKLASVDDIVASALAIISGAEGPSVSRDLEGRRFVITAGPTHEAIDPVRFIANASTGKMGYVIAREAARRGAAVTIVAGPVSLEDPRACDVVHVVSAREMRDAAHAAFRSADVAICTAAVADFRPAEPSDRKLKKGTDRLDTMALVENPDILAELSATREGRIVVGFAAETNDLLPNAQAKLMRKGCDLIVANDVSRADSTFGADTSRIAFVTPDGIQQLETMPLAQVATAIIDRVASMLEGR